MSEVYRDGWVHVRGERCDACLFSSHRLVSGDRARVLIAQTRSGAGTPFICHKGQVSKEGDSICRAWFDAFADQDWVVRFAQAEGRIKFTTPPEDT